MPPSGEHAIDAPTQHAVRELWHNAVLPDEALACLVLQGEGFVLPSSFAVASAAQASIGAAALAAAHIGFERSAVRDTVTVGREHATLECLGYFTLDGVRKEPWEKLSGLYPCGGATPAGWVRIHANFAHHRDGALRLLGLPPGEATTRDQVRAALAAWGAKEFEEAASAAGLVVAALRTHDEWRVHAQARAIADCAVLTLERIADAPPVTLAPLAAAAAPLDGLRVIDMTRILAGPVAGRALAAYGADVMLVNAPYLPNIANIADTSRGKRSCLADLRTDAGRAALTGLVRDAHILIQAYRPGALEGLGFGPLAAAALRPGIIYGSLSAYGDRGPWSGKRGFDSLVQTATGFNSDEARAAGSDKPRALPMQILDYASGYLMAFGVLAALSRQQREGGSWHVRVALAATGNWLRGLGRNGAGLEVTAPSVVPYLESSESGFGRLEALRQPAHFGRRALAGRRPSAPPGSSPAAW